jgi:hypothetical protein
LSFPKGICVFARITKTTSGGNRSKIFPLKRLFSTPYSEIPYNVNKNTCQVPKALNSHKTREIDIADEFHPILDNRNRGEKGTLRPNSKPPTITI